MLRISNPLGKAFMVTNPAGGDMLRVHRRRNRRSSRRRYGRRSRRRNPAMSFGGDIMEVQSGSIPKGRILPKVKDIGGVIGTLIGGTLGFAGSNAIGVGVKQLVEKVLPAGTLGEKGLGVVTFIGRYVGAHAVAATLFQGTKGLLSKDNGRFMVNITIVAGGLALLRDLGVIAMLPAQVQPYIPQLSAYDSGIHRGSLSRYHGRRLSAYDSGIQRGSLSGHSLRGYDAGVRPGQLSGNYDDMPVELPNYNYGVPLGA